MTAKERLLGSYTQHLSPLRKVLPQGMERIGPYSPVAQIYEVVTKPKFEFGSNLSGPCPKSRTALLKSRPSKGVEKTILSLDEILGLRESPPVHQAFGLGQGGFVKGGNPTSEVVDEVVQFVIG